MKGADMKTIRLDVEDSIFDNVMYFLNNLPKKDVKLNIEARKKDSKQHSIVDFFQNSPLRDSIELERDREIYVDRGRLNF